MSYHLLSAAFTQFRDQRNAAGGLNIASEASYWCNWRETSEIKAQAYSVQRGTRTRMRSIIYTMLCMYVRSCWNMRPANEFCGGFCTLVYI